MIVNSISGPIVDELAECAAFRGQIFLYGRLDDTPTPYPLITCMKKAISVRGYTLWEIVNDPTLRRRAQDWIISKIEQGIIAPVIDRFSGWIRSSRRMPTWTQIARMANWW